MMEMSQINIFIVLVTIISLVLNSIRANVVTPNFTPCGTDWRPMSSLLCKYVVVLKNSYIGSIDEFAEKHNLELDTSQYNNGFMQHFICMRHLESEHTVDGSLDEFFDNICISLSEDDDVEQFSQKSLDRAVHAGAAGKRVKAQQYDLDKVSHSSRYPGLNTDDSNIHQTEFRKASTKSRKKRKNKKKKPRVAEYEM